ncbi:unnamed protein product, partial [Discosporangium mesarthrocarpum]
MARWLADLLADMPLNQRLVPPSLAGAGECDEVELSRRRMREEARSAVLQALGGLLATCKGSARVAVAEIVSQGSEVTRLEGGRAGGTLSLCLKLLRGCGGMEEAHAQGRGVTGRVKATTTEGRGKGHKAGAFLEGRKVELLRLLGNACFRCKAAQDLVRKEGGLPLVLNHCGIDEANEFMREWALLAIRNLCEGNPANQSIIAPLQPQAPSASFYDNLGKMGLVGDLDKYGKLHVRPRDDT